MQEEIYHVSWDDGGDIDVVCVDGDWFIEWDTPTGTDRLEILWITVRMINWDGVPEEVQKRIMAEVIINKL